MSYSFGYNSVPLKRVFGIKEDDKSKPLLAVIITLYAGSSYDALFRTKQQEAPEGGRVSVWQMEINTQNMKDLIFSLDNRTAVAPSLKELFEDIDQVEPFATVFNFECCSQCSDHNGFGNREMDIDTISAMGRLLHFGFFIMTSDFSLKALIKSWDKNVLGECPFIQVGSYSTSCDLRFVPGILKECPSAQLASVGNLCENGEAHVHAMSGTIAFSLKKNYQELVVDQPYTLQVLTVVTQTDGIPVSNDNSESVLASIRDYKGLIGHAVLTYKTGGNLVVSSCHWLELSHLNTSEENVFKTWEINQGVEYAQMMRKEYEAVPLEQQSAQLQSYAARIVQTSAPCQYSPMPFSSSNKS
eukprot:TRINITY_DN521_c0_g1_i1.p1 TRINITY_DN521_c0_g1~~TRINITY_DN521_c0_g1_i1.p1  ORF type:complete len:357 (+),score=47.42 TRINITY_DN521_c0_g1_i1:46-1116(+)